MPVVGFLAGLGTGLVLSMLGAGGSVFIVPVLVYLVHAPMSEATGTSLAIVGTAALVAAVGHVRQDAVHRRVAVPFGAAAMLGAAGGSALHGLASERTHTLLFAAILFVAAGQMIFGRPAEHGRRELRVHGLLPLGAAIGALSGFIGVGGGFLIVPALSIGARLPVRLAIGTSLVVVAASSLTGAAVHLAQGRLTPGVLGTVGLGAVLGAFAGAPLSGKLPDRPLRLGFATLAAAVGAFMVWKG